MTPTQYNRKGVHNLTIQDAMNDGARGPYLGALLDNCHSQQQLGFPKVKATLMGWPDRQLRAEQRKMLKASFGMFGHNAKKMLVLIEAEIAARKRAAWMTPAQYIEALRKLGLTPYAAALYIGISIRQSLRYASGESKIPGPVAKLIRMMLKEAKSNPQLWPPTVT
jgi:hypothetical protein